jgi:Cu(I)/Ag(I) efflux system membrane fusion protein
VEGGAIIVGCPVRFGLKTQVNVSYAKSLKIGQSATVSLRIIPPKKCAKISFINPEINPDSDCY